MKLAGGLGTDLPALLEGIVYSCPPGVEGPGEFEITPVERP